MKGVHQRVELSERPQARIDVRVVGDVVAEVGIRRGVDGGEPDGADPQPGQVVHPFPDPRQVADAVAGCVEEASRIDLVDHVALPPRRAVRDPGSSLAAHRFSHRLAPELWRRVACGVVVSTTTPPAVWAAGRA